MSARRGGSKALQIMRLSQPVGLHKASQVAWILMVSPPFERPIASVSRFPFCARAVLARPDDGGIDHGVFIVGVFGQMYGSIHFLPFPVVFIELKMRKSILPVLGMALFFWAVPAHAQKSFVTDELTSDATRL